MMKQMLYRLCITLLCAFVDIAEGGGISPTEVTASAGTDTSCVRVAWRAETGTLGYSVYRSETLTADHAQALASVSTCAYSDATALSGKTYTYFVKARYSAGTSAFSAGASGWRAMLAPINLQASDGTSDSQVNLSWGLAEAGVTHFQVSRSIPSDNDSITHFAWQKGMTFADTSAVPGTVYRYQVKGAIDGNGTHVSTDSVADTGFRAVPAIVESLMISGAPTLASGDQTTYTCIAIYTDGSTKAVTPAWRLVSGGGSISGAGVFSAPSVAMNTTVVLSATWTGEGTMAGQKRVTVVAKEPDVPMGLTVAETTATGIALRWSPMATASWYELWRGATNVSALAQQIDVSETAAYTDCSVAPGVLANYWVKAVNSVGISGFSTNVTAYRLFEAPTGVKVNAEHTGVSVTWDAVQGATHYRVSCAATLDGMPSDLGEWQSATHFVDTSSVAQSSGWYFVRAALDAAGTQEGAKSEGVCLGASLTSISVFGPDVLATRGVGYYGCQAVYSNGTSQVVTPVWTLISGSPSADLSTNGCLTTGAVSNQDTNVVLQAAFGGLTATKSVRIQAPVTATATLSNVVVRSRWPYNGWVDIDYMLAVTPAEKVATITVAGLDKDLGKPLAAFTLTGDGATGTVASGIRRVSWHLAADYPEFHASAFSIKLDAVPYFIVRPTGVSTGDGKDTEAVPLTWISVPGAIRYEIWRDGVLQWETNSTMFSDTNTFPGVSHSYQVRAFGECDTSAFSDTIWGCRALKAPKVDTTMDVDRVMIGWDEIVGAQSYEVLRAPSDSEEAPLVLARGLTERTFTDTTAMTGVDYDYWVKAVGEDSSTTSDPCQGAIQKDVFMIIDMGANVPFTVSFDQEMPEEGWTGEVYKTTSIVLRLIPAGTYTMGSPSGELGRDTLYPETQHQVTISKPFYIGVFEVTQKQWELVMGDRPSGFSGDTHPVETVTYNKVAVRAQGNFMATLRAKTEDSGFDLPTEAQWEYACRAGTTAALNSGKNLTSKSQCTNMDEVGCYDYTSTENREGNTNGHTTVGHFLPNRWGLYDMHGNVWEWCKDAYRPYSAASVTDPFNTGTADEKRVLRGGGWNSDAERCRSAQRLQYLPYEYSNMYGFRIIYVPEDDSEME